jgi:hypothetical protein
MKLGSSYFGNRIVKHVAADMRDLRKRHFNYVVHTFSENDYQFFRGTMREIVRASHDAGLEAHIDPWGVAKIFGGEAFSQFAASNFHVLQVLSDGKPAPVACPNHPELRAFMKDWIDAAVETEADVLFWDEPHFYLSGWLGGRPNTWGCLCEVCKKKFAAQFGHAMPQELTPEVEQFREDSLRDFLAEMIIYTHSLGKRNALCVLPHDEKENPDWAAFAALSGLNIFGTDPYWYGAKREVGEMVGYFSRKVMEVCRARNETLPAGKQVQAQIWIQGFKVPAGREEEIRTAIEVAVEAGVRDLAVWGFEACGHMSSIRSDNPERVWDIITDAFAQIENL